MNDTRPEVACYRFSEGALKEIVPVLLWLLTKKEEDEDEDEWNVSMAASICLQLFAQVTRDSIVEHTIRFVESHIRSPEWNYREAAVMAFGCIMDGPSIKVLTPLCSTVRIANLFELLLISRP